MDFASKAQMLCIQEQAAFGTAETDVAGADIIECIGAPKMDLNSESTQIELVAGAFDQDAAIPGIMSYDLSFSAYARAAAADTVGQFGKLLKLSAMTEAEGTDGIFTYVFNSNRSLWKDFTAWLYSGSLASSGSNLRKGFNGIITPKFTIEAGKPGIMACQAKLAVTGAATVSTQPSITKERTLPAAFVGASTVTINGDSDYRVLSCEIDAGQVTSLLKDPKQTYGSGMSTVTDRKIKFSAKVYKDIPSVVDPEAALFGKTIGALALEYGTVPQKVKFSSTYSQIIDIKDDEEEGVECWKIDGLFERNDFTITLSTK